jgi:transposase, IS5 family
MAVRTLHPTTLWGWLVQQLLAPAHDLLVLARQIDWDAIVAALQPFYKPRGRYAKPIRLMVGLHLLKHRYHLSDAAVVQGVHENLYWMTFCGIEVGTVFAQAKLGEPVQWVEASTLCKWRQRLGGTGTHVLEHVIQQQLVRAKVLCPQTMLTDTTAMEKHIAYPTDTALLDKGRQRLVTLLRRARTAGVHVAPGLRSFRRTARRVVVSTVKLGHDRLERVQAANRRLSTMAQHVLRRVPRVLAQLSGKFGALRRQGHTQAAMAVHRLREQLQHTAVLVRRVIHQNAERFHGRHVPDKVLSLHEPHVVAIRKGKRTKPTEYGCKVSLSMDRWGFIVTHTEYAANVADVETLPEALRGWQVRLGRLPTEVGGDRGFHHRAADSHRLGLGPVGRVGIAPKGNRSHPASATAWYKRLQRLRGQIEPVISHRKTDHGMVRCRYKGFGGDQINVSWAVLAWNTKKWGRLLQQRHMAGREATRPAA